MSERDPVAQYLPAGLRVLFIGGSGKSGTSSAKKQIAEHPKCFAVPFESQPYPMHRGQWAYWCKHVLGVYGREAKEKGCSWLVEKSPGNALYAAELCCRVPGSLYLHVCRETQATRKSLMRFGEKAGVMPIKQLGNPRGICAIDAYLTYVSIMAECAEYNLGPRYRKVRIETLDPQEVWRWMGLPNTA
jgi:hypothetical protein